MLPRPPPRRQGAAEEQGNAMTENEATPADTVDGGHLEIQSSRKSTIIAPASRPDHGAAALVPFGEHREGKR
jgi:hypothetical protein